MHLPRRHMVFLYSATFQPDHILGKSYFHIRAREKQTEKENAAKIRNMKIGYLRVFPPEL